MSLCGNLNLNMSQLEWLIPMNFLNRTVHLTMQKQRWHLNTQLFFTTTYVQQRNFDKSRSTFGCSVSVVVRFVSWKLASFCHGQHCLNAETKLNDSNMVASCRKQLKSWKFTKSDLSVHCSIHLRPTVSVHPVYNVFGPLQANTIPLLEIPIATVTVCVWDYRISSCKYVSRGLR